MTGIQWTLRTNQKCYTIRGLMLEMHRRGTSYWSWNDEEWVETIGPTMKAFIQQHASKVVTARQHLFSVAYVLTAFAAFDRFPIHGIELTTLSLAVFGRESMASSLERILGVLTKWGYKRIQGKIHTALVYTLLKNRSPHLEDITFELLLALNQKAQTKYSLPQLYPLSRALAELKIIQTPLPLRRQSRPLLERIDTEGVAQEWLDWCFAWYRQATQSRVFKKQSPLWFNADRALVGRNSSPSDQSRAMGLRAGSRFYRSRRSVEGWRLAFVERGSLEIQ